MFAKEVGELRTRRDLRGQPLQAYNLGERSFDRIRKAAEVRRIEFSRPETHLRDAAASGWRTGSRRCLASRTFDVPITLNTYAHVLPDTQQGAADRLSAVLHRRGLKSAVSLAGENGLDDN